MRFFRNLAGVLLTTAVSAPVGLLTSVLLARFLSTDDRGLYAVALAFAATATVVFQVGWPTASIFRLRAARVDPAEVSGAALLALGSLSVLVVAGTVLLEPVLRERFLGELPEAILYLALATVPSRLLANGFGAIARGIDRFRYENWYSFGLQVGNLAAVAVVVVWLGGALYELMVALAGVYALLVLGLMAMVLRQTGVARRLRVRELTRSLRFGLKSHAMAVTGRLHERVDVFMLAALLGDATQVAYFAVAKGGVQVLQLLPQALARVAYPQLAGLEREDAAELCCMLVRQTVLLTVPAALALAVVAPILVPLVYGDPYESSVLPFLLLLPTVTLMGSDRIIARYFMAMNRQKPNLAVRTLSLTVNVVLNYLWIPRYGIHGAAAAALASYAVDALTLAAVFLFVSGRRPGDLLRLRRSDLEPYLVKLRELLRRVRQREARGA